MITVIDTRFIFGTVERLLRRLNSGRPHVPCREDTLSRLTVEHRNSVLGGVSVNREVGVSTGSINMWFRLGDNSSFFFFYFNCILRTQTTFDLTTGIVEEYKKCDQR